MTRKLALLATLILSSSLAACASAPPLPVPPDPPSPWRDGNPIAVDGANDSGSLRSSAEHQRERMTSLIDLAERRELREGGPKMLVAAKEQSRVLDGIEARLDAIDHDPSLGSRERTAELDVVEEELRRFSARLDLLSDTLR
jgi:predicted small lipoprotein YifL